MKAVTWQGRRDIRVEEVPDPILKESTDAIVKITSTGLCGSDLHLYETLTPFMTPGDVVGHEPMGIVEEVGSGGREPQPGGPGRAPVQRLVRPLLDVRPPAVQPVRDDPEPRVRHRRRLLRLQQALRADPRRPGGVPPRPVRGLHADQGAGGAARRPLPVPLRRAAHGLAGGPVRRGPGRRDPPGDGPRTDRRHVGAGRPPPRLSGHRRRPRAGAPRPGRRPGRRGDRPDRRRRHRRTRSAS